MAIGNVRPFVLDTSGFDNALSGMFAGIKQRRQDAEYGDLLNTLSAPAPVMNALSGPSEVGAPPSVTSNPSIDANAPTRGGFTPKYLVMHDYGGNPKNAEGVHNPYHALVFPDGSIRYRDPNNPYGGKAPHAYNLNSESIGLSYAGPVGSKPTPEAMATLQKEAQRIAQMYPGIRPMSHGEAFQATKGTARQASKLGRGLDEASWRQNVVYGPAGQPGQAAPQPQAIPVASRAVTAVAGSQPVRTADAGDGRSAALEWARRNPGHPAAKAIGQEVLSQQLDPMASVKQQQAQANLQNTLTEQQRSQVEFFGKRAMAIQQMSPEIRARVWPQVLAELQRAFPNDPIDPEEADPETGPQILAAQAGMLLDPMAGEERRLKMEQLRADTEVSRRKLEPDPIEAYIRSKLPQAQPAAPAQPMLQQQSFLGQPQVAPGVQLIADDSQALQSPAPQPPAPDVDTVDIPMFGKMPRKDAQELGMMLQMNPKYSTLGKSIMEMSGGAGGAGISKPAENQLDERTISAASTLGRMQDIRKQFKPEFLQIPNKLKLYGASWGAAFGGKLSPELEGQLRDFSAFKATAFDNFNQLLKELSGTAVSAQELARQKIVQPNPGEGLFDGDDPVTFMSKMDQAEKVQKSAIARMNFMRSKGLMFNKDTAERFMRLEDVPKAIDERGAQIERELKGANPKADPMAIQKETERRLKQEFGI